MVKSIKVHTQKINSLVALKDCLVSSSDDGTIKLFDYKNLECQATLSDHKGSVITLASNDQILASGSFDGIKIWTWDKKSK